MSLIGSIFTRGPNFFKRPVPFAEMFFFFFLLDYFHFYCFDALGLRALGNCVMACMRIRVSYVLALII